MRLSNRATTVGVERAATGYFSVRFALAVAAALLAALILAPLAADLLAAAGFRFPFPRIFDRVVMVAVFAVMLLTARSLGFAPLMRSGFAEPRGNVGHFGIGLVLGLASIAILFALAISVREPRAMVSLAAVLGRALKYIVPALIIGLIEEGFFRAFLLAGMMRDFKRGTALIASSAIYALAHLVRAPARFYIIGYHPAAGLIDLGLSVAQLSHPLASARSFLGLTLLGLVLGRGFLITGNVYFSIALHSAFVLGAKTWPAIARGARPFPFWLAGPGPVPLIAAPAAWILALVLLYALPLILTSRSRADAAAEDFLGG